MVTRWLRTSDNLDPIPELLSTQNSITLDPSMFASWSDAFDADETTTDFLLRGGDYRSWGPCTLRNRSGRSSRRNVIRSLDLSARPWHQGGNQAVLDSIFFQDSSHWIVHGLAFRAGPRVQGKILADAGSDGITVDSVIIEDFEVFGVEFIGNRNTVQNSIIRNSIRGLDGVGVLIRVAGAPNVGNRILDCEIYDCNDGVGLTWDNSTPETKNIECRDLLIEGNDIYVTPARYVKLDGDYATVENAADFKAGPDQGRNVFRNNLIWGVRSGVGGTDGPDSTPGAAIVIHRRARNMLFEENVVFDCPVAFMEVVHDKDDQPDRPRGIDVHDNVFSALGRYRPDDLSTVLRTRESFTLRGNRFSRSGRLSAFTKAVVMGQRLADDFSGNILHDVELGDAEADWNVAGNNQISPPELMEDLHLQRRRWTGPEFVVLEKAERVTMPPDVAADTGPVFPELR